MRAIFLFCLGFVSAAHACTDFVVEATDRTLVNGRSLEFGMDLQTKLQVFARNQQVSSQNPEKKKGTSWVSKYGYLGATILNKNLVIDGLNEAGLSFGFLWLPGTQYPKVAPQEMKKALDFVDFGSWVLGNFATVAELKNALRDVCVWGHPLSPFPEVPPVHAAIHDEKGNHLVVEFIKGEMKVHDNPNTVLTNAPPLEWHLLNLCNYLSLKAINAGPINLNGSVLAPPGQGSGLLGIPGDWTPPSRFVRMTTFLHFAKKAGMADEAVNLAEHLLNTVDIPLGEIRDQDSNQDYTQWIVIKDLSHQKFYFRSYKDLGLKMIDLKKLNFETGSNQTLPINLGKKYLDVTSAFEPAKPIVHN